MMKLVKASLAIVLGLVMSLTLLTSGLFAQSVHPSNTSATARIAVASTSVLGMSQARQLAQIQPASHQRVTFWQRGRGRNITCAIHYRPYRVYQNGRWIYICRRY